MTTPELAALRRLARRLERDLEEWPHAIVAAVEAERLDAPSGAVQRVADAAGLSQHRIYQLCSMHKRGTF